MFLHYLFYFFILTSHLSAIHSDCSSIEFCICDINTNVVICDANYGNQTENDYFSSFSLLPSVEKYIFRNFQQIQAHTFQNMTFLTNSLITIHLINITMINTDAFSSSLIIPNNSIISIDIEYSTNPLSITLQLNAFNHIKINRLRFFNINNFNGRPIFDTSCFSENLQINELIFEQSDITGFSNIIQKPANIKNLYILNCPTFTQITNNSLPSFIVTTELLEISKTGLKFINVHTFQARSLILRELIIRNNINFKKFSSNIVDGILNNLDKLDLSNNSINIFEQDFDWSPYSYIKHLIFKQQQFDLLLKTNILKSLKYLTTIDFSEGFIIENNESLIYDYIPNMFNLISLNISYTNLTENMIINLLEHLSNSTNQTIKISLLGYQLNDDKFCSYFTIFQKSSNLFQFELDETHECNCIVDLFFNDKQIQIIMNDSLIQPICLFNTTRTHCNIQSQLNISKCSIDKPNPDESGTDDNNGTKYALIGIIVGTCVLLLILLAIGSGIVYRRLQKSRHMGVIDMEEPIENPLAVIIEQRLHASH
ncbi:unnamed protein product [Rotaria sordida]|uniref:Uncharacterized protein n=1 Tax=Rotaria sordida TaxID=392033 RepID=A0A813V9M5_9BILA|nr:unnamed protein product [Rotaria sordida]